MNLLLFFSSLLLFPIKPSSRLKYQLSPLLSILWSKTRPSSLFHYITTPSSSIVWILLPLPQINPHFKFTSDLLISQLITHPSINLSDIVDYYNATLSAILDKPALRETKTIRAKPPNPWFTHGLSLLRSARRNLEKIFEATISNFFALPLTHITLPLFKPLSLTHITLPLFKSLPLTHITLPLLNPKKSLILHIIHHRRLILESLGTLSLSFFVTKLFTASI